MEKEGDDVRARGLGGGRRGGRGGEQPAGEACGWRAEVWRRAEASRQSDRPRLFGALRRGANKTVQADSEENVSQSEGPVIIEVG